MPRVSAIVPSYNHAPFVAEAVEGVLAQDADLDLEVIVIDDGSTDGSDAILARFGDDPRVRLETRTNRGITPTFNDGLELAGGEVVAFCCSDDRWHPNHLRLAWSSLEANPDAVVSFGRAQMIDEFGNPSPEPSIFGSLSDPDPLPRLLREGNSLCFSAAAFRREAAAAVGGFSADLVVLQDYDLWLRLLARGGAVYVPETTVDFRWYGANASGPAGQLQRRRDLVSILVGALETLPLLQEDAALREEVTKRLRATHLRLARLLPDPAEREHHRREARRLGASIWRTGLTRLRGALGM